jgi:hypothetical protein
MSRVCRATRAVLRQGRCRGGPVASQIPQDPQRCKGGSSRGPIGGACGGQWVGQNFTRSRAAIHPIGAGRRCWQGSCCLAMPSNNLRPFGPQAASRRAYEAPLRMPPSAAYRGLAALGTPPTAGYRGPRTVCAVAAPRKHPSVFSYAEPMDRTRDQTCGASALRSSAGCVDAQGAAASKDAASEVTAQCQKGGPHCAVPSFPGQGGDALSPGVAARRG